MLGNISVSAKINQYYIDVITRRILQRILHEESKKMFRNLRNEKKAISEECANC